MFNESIHPSVEQILTAKREIGHRADGPITSFVLIARATEYAFRSGKHRAAAEALAELLEDYNFIINKDRSYETGS